MTAIITYSKVSRETADKLKNEANKTLNLGITSDHAHFLETHGVEFNLDYFEFAQTLKIEILSAKILGFSIPLHTAAENIGNILRSMASLVPDSVKVS